MRRSPAFGGARRCCISSAIFGKIGSSEVVETLQKRGFLMLERLPPDPNLPIRQTPHPTVEVFNFVLRNLAHYLIVLVRLR